MSKNKRVSKNDILTKELKTLEEKNGSLTPQAVVTAASSPDSVLHGFFQWDDTVAAREYRLWQARQMIASVTVIVEGRKTDAYFNVRAEVDVVPQRGYFSVDAVLSKQEIYQQVLETALSELEYWQKKFSQLKELRGIVNKKKLSMLRSGKVR